jgi:hypothetical protein
MLKPLLFRTAFGGLLLLASAQTLADAQQLPVKSISFPTWNLISQTLNDMTPLLDGRRNDFLLGQVCGLARGELNSESVKNRLLAHHLDPDVLAAGDSPWALLLNNNLQAQRVVCAASLATSLFQPVQIESYLENIAAMEQPPKAENPSGWAFWRKSESSVSAPKKATLQLDRARFIQDLQSREALAKATAQLYALVSANLPTGEPLSWSDYQQRVVVTMVNYAPDYLRSIGQFYQQDRERPLRLQRLSGNDFEVSGPTGDVIVQQAGVTTFYSQGVTWFGDGKVLGKTDYVLLTLIASSPEAVSPEAVGKKKNRG